VPRPPEPTPGRDDLLLKAYAIWSVDPVPARAMLAGQAARHQERLRAYEADWAAVERRHDGGPPPATHPDFGSYATLRCGIDYERQRIAWLQWMDQRLAAG
jgi:hypothetical protein